MNSFYQVSFIGLMIIYINNYESNDDDDNDDHDDHTITLMNNEIQGNQFL